MGAVAGFLVQVGGDIPAAYGEESGSGSTREERRGEAHSGKPGDGKGVRWRRSEAHHSQGKEQHQHTDLDKCEPDLQIAAELDPFSDDGAYRHEPTGGHQGHRALTVDTTGRQQLQGCRGGGKSAGDHEHSGADEQRPADEKPERRRENRRDPGIGDAGVDHQAV